jgi:hypothetical protein
MKDGLWGFLPKVLNFRILRLAKVWYVTFLVDIRGIFEFIIGH